MSSTISIGLNAVILAVSEQRPKVLTVAPGVSGAAAALPSGPFDPTSDRTLELALKDWVRAQTALELGYVEQLYTFADIGRSTSATAVRPVSIAYLGLARETANAVPAARWIDCYEFLPWEDWRAGTPAIIADLRRALQTWAKGGSPAQRSQRTERLEICFGLTDAGWDGYKVLERYELLYEAGLVAEYARDHDESVQTKPAVHGLLMESDHRRILATALGRVRGKLRYRPVVFELMEPSFTLMQLQLVVEALSGLKLHKQNFRRLVGQSGLVEETGDLETSTGGRPAKRFRFRREVLRERRAPGVGALAVPKRVS